MSNQSLGKTALHAEHVAAGGKMVDFAGWHMPLNYGSQIEEHKQVRACAGQFDVSHMTVIDAQGAGLVDFLRRVVANNIDKLKAPGRALYGALLNEAGGVIDDLIVYRRAEGFRLVVNAGTRQKVLDWLALQQGDDTSFTFIERADLAILAVQGPEAIARCAEALPRTAAAAELKPFWMIEDGEWMVARTGYTGEDGFELILPNSDAVAAYRALLTAGVPPIGLGARDTLRLEAGLNLYGHDMDENVNPLSANMAWTIGWAPEDRDFIGRRALAEIKAAGSHEQLLGVVLRDRGVLREGQEITTNAGPGVLTSGAFSPTLGYSIAFARVPLAATGKATVEIRKKQFDIELVRPPFVRNGIQVYKPL